MNQQILLDVIQCSAMWKSTDHKVYTEREDTIKFLLRMGGQLCDNHPQIGGGWVTSVRMGLVVFVHASENQIVMTK